MLHMSAYAPASEVSRCIGDERCIGGGGGLERPRLSKVVSPSESDGSP